MICANSRAKTEEAEGYNHARVSVSYTLRPDKWMDLFDNFCKASQRPVLSKWWTAEID